MFTGIIRNVIKLDRIKKDKNYISIHIRLPFSVSIGDSVSINGICLTVSKITGKTSVFNVSSETAKRSNLLHLKLGDYVNIEPSMRIDDMFHGHLVYGHIDGVGKISNIKEAQGSYEFVIEYPPQLSMFIAKKGSIALDGVSLTITEIMENYFKVILLEYTFSNTNFRYKERGDILNIEIDPITRYLKRLLEFK
jgi:riboflavin synthase